MSSIAERVARRFWAFKYEPKEKKQTKVDRIMRVIRDRTGVSRGVAEAIADALVRGREVNRLAIQKGWPIQDDDIIGPQGTLALTEVSAMV
jgi:hypothetical protein